MNDKEYVILYYVLDILTKYITEEDGIYYIKYQDDVSPYISCSGKN